MIQGTKHITGECHTKCRLSTEKEKLSEKDSQTINLRKVNGKEPLGERTQEPVKLAA